MTAKVVENAIQRLDFGNLVTENERVESPKIAKVQYLGFYGFSTLPFSKSLILPLEYTR